MSDVKQMSIPNFAVTMRIKPILAAIATVFAVFAASAAPVLVSASPWGQNKDVDNMNAVFGAGQYSLYTSYTGLNVASIFSVGNNMVMLEGGASTDSALASFLTTNSVSILNWVNAGGALLIQSAGWASNVSFAGVTLNLGSFACGTLTSAGVSAFGVAASQCGNSVAHDYITGADLTPYMTSGANMLVAGKEVGAGYIMYSGLTTSQFHNSGSGLVNGVVRFTAAQAGEVPEPASLALVGVAALAAGAARRRKAA